MDKGLNEIIVISAINLRMGGGLSILKDCLLYLQKKLSSKYDIVALVHKNDLFNNMNMFKIKFIEFPQNSYFYRFYYEYYYFNRLSQKLKPYLWLSLHDITPNIKSGLGAVYCHNPPPFYKCSLKEILLDPKFYIFTLNHR